MTPGVNTLAEAVMDEIAAHRDAGVAGPRGVIRYYGNNVFEPYSTVNLLSMKVQDLDLEAVLRRALERCNYALVPR